MPHISWFEIPIAPLRWVEQTRGRWRLALLCGYALVLGVGGVLIGRETVLWDLPAAPEPFDLKGYGHVNLPDSDNAVPLYREATRHLVPSGKIFAELSRSAGDPRDWATADPQVRAWADSNARALDLWLQGSARPDALFLQPDQTTIESSLTASDLRTLTHLGTLAATKRHAAGDLAGAWVYHRAVVRSALHAARYGGLIPLLISARILGLASPSIARWISDSGQTTDLLRLARVDLAACEALRPALADALRVEYFVNRAALSEPAEWIRSNVDRIDPTVWYQNLPGFMWSRDFLANEPKRSLRVLRLITASQLAQADRPWAFQPQLIGTDYLIYEVDPATLVELTRIKPKILAGWDAAWGFKNAFVNRNVAPAQIQAIHGLLDKLKLAGAERAYVLDHGGQPAQRYGDLLGGYLDSLPMGIDPRDLLPLP